MYTINIYKHLTAHDGTTMVRNMNPLSSNCFCSRLLVLSLVCFFTLAFVVCDRAGTQTPLYWSKRLTSMCALQPTQRLSAHIVISQNEHRADTSEAVTAVKVPGLAFLQKNGKNKHD